MRKQLWTAMLAVILTTAVLFAVTACGGPSVDYGTLTVANVSVIAGKQATVEPTFSIEDKAEEIVYSFDGSNISIADGVVTGLVGGTETVVTATTAHHSATFTVTVVDCGTLAVEDVTLMEGQEQLLLPVFSVAEFEDDIVYSFDGSNISIEGNLVKGLVPDTETVVTATTEYHTTSFTVKVEYMHAELSSATGSESKYRMTPPASDQYVLTGEVEVNEWRENGWTRLSAFAFNASDNSWYNVEMNEVGQVMLYARFNGLERYHMDLFHINDEGVLVNGKICYTFALLKDGQATKFFINDKEVCSFLAAELNGYATLEGLEVTACADRANAGSYSVMINKLRFGTEESELYARYAGDGKTLMQFADFHLSAEDGGERKFVVANGTLPAEDFYFATTVVVDRCEDAFTRTSSFAFNASDNSWYNIEMNGEGNFTLYGRFNGVEKYGIHLFNRNDDGIVVDGKIRYTVELVKQGRDTYFFVNGKYICSFAEQELEGYAELAGFELTAATDASWREGQAYGITFTDTVVKSASATEYAECLSRATAPIEVEASLVSDNGAEQKQVIATSLHATGRYSVMTATVTVNSYDPTAWFRPSAFAFNASDNSWFNIELGGDGNVTLYAQFNGVQKYGIHLFKTSDEGIVVNGKLTYSVALLKCGQAVTFFVNDVVVASFTEADLGGYATLNSLEMTASADRSGKAFDVSAEICVYGASSDTFASYFELAQEQ